MSGPQNDKAVASDNIELGNLPPLPASASTSLYKINQDPNATEESPLAPQTSSEPEPKNNNDHSSQLQKLIELTQQLLESSRRREQDSVPDLERNADMHRRGIFDDVEDKESIWARTEPWKIEKVTVMTEEEMKQDPLWVDKFMATSEFAEIEKDWNDLWPDVTVETSQAIQLQILLAFLCQEGAGDYLRSTVSNSDLRTSIPGKFQTPISLNLAISRSYLKFVGTQIRSVLNQACFYLPSNLEFLPIFKIFLDTLARSNCGFLVRCEFTVGDILFECYRRGILEQPDMADRNVYRWHTVMIISAAHVLDHPHRDHFLSGDAENITRNQIAENLLGLSVYDTIHLFRRKDDSCHDRVTGRTFRADDLNIDSLRSIGQLEIFWTAVLQDHLLLNLSTRQLQICWFVGFAAEYSSPIKIFLS